MKKIFIFLLLLFASLAYSSSRFDNKKLLDDISKRIAEHQEYISQNTEYESEGLWWSNINFVHPGSKHSYTTTLFPGYSYILYTETSGPKVRVCLANKFFSRMRCAPCGRRITFIFKIYKKDTYKILMRHISKDKGDVGIYVSYLTILYKKKTNFNIIRNIEDIILNEM
ncbi:MAG: hypothetical protein ACFFG0_02350 [Candidatus Thorarchaeota archaeon]